MPIYDPGGQPAPKKPKNQPYNPYPNGPYRVPDPDTNGQNTTYYPGGVDTGNPGQPQGPATPPPPVPAAPPAPPAPPPPPPRMDWGAYLSADPGYAATIANLQAQQAQLYNQYGFVPAGSKLIGTGSDIGMDTAYAAAGNPNSQLAQLAHQLSGNIQGINDTANAHGVLTSGINLRNQRNEYTADQSRRAGALSALQQALLGLGGQQASALEQARRDWWNYFNAPAGS